MVGGRGSGGDGGGRVVLHEYAPMKEEWPTKNNQKEEKDDEDIHRRNRSRTI